MADFKFKKQENKQTEKQPLVSACGLYCNETKDGKTFFSGKMGNLRVLIFENSHKTEDKHPDFNMFFSNDVKKDDPKKPEEKTENEDVL